MGEVTEMILEGLLCQCCGGFDEKSFVENGGCYIMHPLKPENRVIVKSPGHPWTCQDCRE